MAFPLDVRFRNMRSSEAIEAAVRDHAGKLDRFHPRITSCRVTIEGHHRRHEKGMAFHVCVDVTVPGHELVARSEPPPHHLHEDVFIAVRDAFDEVRRELQDDAQRRRGFVKTHASRPAGAPAGEASAPSVTATSASGPAPGK